MLVRPAFADYVARRLQGKSHVLLLGCCQDEIQARLKETVFETVPADTSVADALASFAPESFDAVVGLNVMSELADRQQVREILGQIRNLLRVDGRLVVVEPNARYVGRRFWESLANSVPLSDRSLVEAAAECGLEPRRLAPKFLPLASSASLERVCIRSEWAQALFGRRLLLEATRPAATVVVNVEDFVAESVRPVRHLALLGVILLLALAARLYHITEPPIDDHYWRQTQTLMIAENFYKQRLNLFLPSVNWRALDSVHPEGWVGVTELSITPYLTALLYYVFGDADWVGRVIPIILSLIGIAYFHRLTTRFCGPIAGTVGALLLACSPFFLFLSRVQMPESYVFCMSFVALYYLDRWLWSDDGGCFWPASLSCAFMLLGKPQVAYMAVPMAFLVLTRLGWRAVLEKRLYAYALVVVVPNAAYYLWSFKILPGMTGIQFGEASVGQLGLSYLINPEFGARILGTIWSAAVGPVVCVLGLAGLLTPARTWRGWFPHVYLLGCALGTVMTPGLSYANSYYQVAFAPPAIMLGARLTGFAYRSRAAAIPASLVLLAAVVTSFHAAAPRYWPHATDPYHCGQWIQENMPKESALLVVGINPAVLYYAERIGWKSDPYPGSPFFFDKALVDRVQKLGAAAVVWPEGVTLDNYAAERRYADMRDYLYDTFFSVRKDNFAVFLLNQPANLRLPRDGRVCFGNWDDFKYLRGAFARRYATPTGETYVDKDDGPGAIVFNAPTGLRSISLKLSVPVDDQKINVSVDGKAGTCVLPKRWKQEHLRLQIEPSLGTDGRHAISLDVPKEGTTNRHLLLWSLDAENGG